MTQDAAITIEPFDLPRQELLALADEHRLQFQSAEPFPHAVFDDFLPEWILDRVLSEFPNPNDAPWIEFKQVTSKKLASNGDELFGPYTRRLLADLNSATFLQFLERLSGLDGLIPDPYYFGGGLHQIETGGFLKVHVDFGRHDRLNLDRRLNAIIYLNRDWDESYGGALELWDDGMNRAVQSILPVFNRCVIFATQGAFHGHPDPLTCPPDRTRKSLALFYYRNDHGPAIDEPDDSTRYRARPNERLISPRTVIKRLAPPILLDAARAVRARLRG